MSASPAALEPGLAVALLRSSLEAIATEVAALPEAVLTWHPAPGEWSVKEVLGHLIEAERRGFSGRIALMLAAHEPHLQRWEPDEVARARHDNARAAAELVRELTTLREEGLVLVRRLTHGDLARGGRHPTVGHLLVSDILHEWVHHDRNHLKQIVTNVQAWTWPHMGNTQKFS